MGRMVKIAGTNEVGNSNQLYKIGTKWFKSKTHYINTLKRKARNPISFS